MNKAIPIGIVAASGVVPQVELERGLGRLRESGFDPHVHEQVAKQSFTFAGNDEERAGAFYAYAKDPRFFILWMARGGYGAGRLLPLLDDLTNGHGTPPTKLLVGYSDVTVLHEYVRSRWGWSTLHAPMPADSSFTRINAGEWQSIIDYVTGKRAAGPWEQTPLTWLTAPPSGPIERELIGGNLSLMASLRGTPYAGAGGSRIIFLEDVHEAFYRIDRKMMQLEQSGLLHHAAAIVLGDFTDCQDETRSARKVYSMDEAWEEIFGKLGKRLGIPVAKGLGVGHGPSFAPLPLGATYELSPSGSIKLLKWDWLTRRTQILASDAKALLT